MSAAGMPDRRRLTDRRAGDRHTAEDLPRILIADDHALLLEALAVLLRPVGRVVGVARDGASLLALLDVEHPDLIITDLSMPGMSGFEILRAIRSRRKSVPVLVLTMHADIGTLRTAIAAGATGYVVKSAVSGELTEAVRTVRAGRQYIPPALRAAFSSAPATGIEQLSPRQRAVLEAIATGRSAKQIAALLEITERTVAFHKEQLRKRLGAQSDVELVERLRRAGETSPDAIDGTEET